MEVIWLCLRRNGGRWRLSPPRQWDPALPGQGCACGNPYSLSTPLASRGQQVASVCSNSSPKPRADLGTWAPSVVAHTVSQCEQDLDFGGPSALGFWT